MRWIDTSLPYLLVLLLGTIPTGCRTSGGDGDGDGDADGDADGDGDGDGDADGDGDGDSCCVTVSGAWTEALTLCAGPDSDAPTIGVSGGGTSIALNARLDRAVERESSLLVGAFEAEGAGDYETPMIEVWNDAGTWYENNATTGTVTIDSWPEVGERVTGSFEGMVYNMGGDGPDSYDISGSFCALRAEDQ